MPNYDNLAGIPSEQTTSVTFKNVSGDEDTNSYDIKQYQYPTNLSEAPEFAGHKVVFFINVQGGGKIAKDSAWAVQDIPKSQRSNFAGEKVVNDLASYANLDVLKPKKRLKAAIALYVPNSLQSSYSVNWGVESGDDMITGESVAKGLLAAGGKGEYAKSASSAMGKIGGALIDAVKIGATDQATKSLNGMKYVQKALGVTPGQSKAQQLFQSVDFRDFSFQYTFAPKSSEEAKQVLNIVRLFKHHMLPEYFDTNQYLYIYPSEFEVKYYKGDKENTFIERQYTAVLKRMSINYTSNNQFMTFEDGMPTHINIDMTFQELSTPTKESEPFSGRANT